MDCMRILRFALAG